MCRLQSTPEASPHFNHPAFYPMFDIFINLSILTNFWAKATKRISLRYLFNSPSSFNSSYMPTEVTIHIFYLCSPDQLSRTFEDMLRLSSMPLPNYSTKGWFWFYISSWGLLQDWASVFLLGLKGKRDFAGKVLLGFEVTLTWWQNKYNSWGLEPFFCKASLPQRKDQLQETIRASIADV